MLHLFYHPQGFLVYNDKKEVVYESSLTIMSVDDYDHLRDTVEYEVMKKLDADKKELIILLILLGNLAVARDIGSRNEINRVRKQLRSIAHVSYVDDVDEASSMMQYYKDDILRMWNS